MTRLQLLGSKNRNHNSPDRYLITNKPGHPDSYASVLIEYLIAPCMLLGVATALYYHYTIQSSLQDILLFTIPVILIGAFVGTLLASFLSLASITVAVIFTVPTKAFLHSLSSLNDLRKSD